MADRLPEFWLRGPIDGVPGELQPVAHALLQAREELRELAPSIRDDLLWTRPAGVASVGFHLRHMSGVIDRLFTYARGEALDDRQREALRAESLASDDSVAAVDLIHTFEDHVDRSIEWLRATDESTLGDIRGVGRKALPATVRGLLFHAAEHVQRHYGQLLVTVRIQTTQATIDG